MDRNLRKREERGTELPRLDRMANLAEIPARAAPWLARKIAAMAGAGLPDQRATPGSLIRGEDQELVRGADSLTGAQGRRPSQATALSPRGADEPD